MGDSAHRRLRGRRLLAPLAALLAVLVLGSLAAATDLRGSGPSPGTPTDPLTASRNGPAPVPSSEGPDPHARGGTLTNGCHFDPRGLPACGAYVGASHGGNDEPVVLEAAAGAPLGVRRTFFTSRQVGYAVATARTDLLMGRLPWISFKLPLPWSDMASGQGDAWVGDLAARLSELPGPVWVAFHHEPEGEGDLADWRAMQEHLAPLVRHAAPNVAYTVIVTGYNQLFGDPSFALERIWPRDTTIDVAGFDIYDEYGSTKSGQVISDSPDLASDYFAPLSAWARRQGVAWGLAETGVTDESFARDPGWIGATYDALVADDGVALSYFDSPLNTSASYEITDADKLADFAATSARGARLPR